MDVLVRQAHPGPRVPPYESWEQKIADGYRYKMDEDLPWSVLVDDLPGTVHQVYGGLADPAYLIDVDGRIAFYNMWSYAPALHDAIEALLQQGGRGVVRGGVDHIPYLHPSLTDGLRGLRRGFPQSYIELEMAAPGLAFIFWLGYHLHPLLAPITLRARPLPTLVKAGLTLGAALLVARWMVNHDTNQHMRQAQRA